MQPIEFDLTVVIDFIFARIGYALTWAQTHSVRIHEYVFTFFDIFMGTCTLSAILSYIPGWEEFQDTVTEEEEENSSIDMDEVQEIFGE